MVLASILFSGLLIGQKSNCSAVFKGRIIDDHDETPLSFSVVNLIDSGRSVIANEEARFVFEDLCPGKYRVEIRHVGCEPEFEEVVLRNNQTNSFLFRLEHHHELREVEIAARSISLKEQVNTEIIDGNELTFNRMESLSDAVESVGGASVLKSGPNISKPMIHGVFGNRVAIINQQVKLEDQQWGADHAPALELSESGSVTVVKGARGVEYGPEAIGGALVVNPPPFASQSKTTGTFQAGGFSNGRGGFARGLITGAVLKNKRLKYRFSGSGNKSGDRHAPDYTLNNTGNEHLSFSGALNYRYKTLDISVFQSYSRQAYGILSAAHNGNLTDLNDAIIRGEPFLEQEFSYRIENPRQAVDHSFTQIQASVKPGVNSKLELVYGFQQNQREEYDLRRGNRNILPLVDLRLRTHHATLKWIQVLSPSWNLKTGIEGRLITNKNNPATETRPVVPNYRQQQVGGFTLLSGTPENWEIEAGLRYDYIQTAAFKWYKRTNWEENYEDGFGDFFEYYNSSGTQVFTEPRFQFNNLSGALSTNYRWTENLSTGIRTALASRPPNSPELFSEGLHLGSATIEYGSLDLDTEYAWTGELFGKYETENVVFSAALFYQSFRGFILPEISGIELTIRGAFPRLTYNQINAAYAGVNWRLDWKLNNAFTFRHRGELNRGTDISRQQPLPLTPPPSFLNELSWSPVQDKKWSWGLAAGVNSVFKQGYAPRVIAASELQQLSSEQIESERAKGAFDLAGPPGEYHLLHFRGFITVPWKSKEVQLAVKVNNLLNRRYRNYLNRFRYFAHDTGRNIQFLLTLNF